MCDYKRVFCPLKFWLYTPPLTFIGDCCLACMYEPAYVHVPYVCQATLLCGYIIDKLLWYIVTCYWCCRMSHKIMPVKIQQAWPVLGWVFSSRNELCASKVTIRFAGLALTCIEAFVYGCRCGGKGTKYSYRSNVKLYWRVIEEVLGKVD